MKLNFSKVNPAGNVTIYIWDPVPEKMHAVVSQQMLAVCHLGGEQVGFVQQPRGNWKKATVRLQMMGGEFCGNASRGLAALLLDRGFPGFEQIGEMSHLSLEVSGSKELIDTWVKSLPNGKYWSECTVPLPLSTKNLQVEVNHRQYKATMVDFPGISHLVVLELAPSKDVFNQISSQFPREAGRDAFGVMFYQLEKDSMTPLVYVKSTNSLVWEGSCGSGSVAVAVSRAIANDKSISNLPLQQPEGLILVDVDYSDGSFLNARIKGEVEFIAEGTVFF
ncbi:MAG: hypothetical protein AAGU27_13215 [Dehalobacterium sp.]